MSGSLNKVQLIGNLGRDPEIRNTQDGNKIVQLTIATTEYWRDKTTNERKDRTEWHKVVIFNDKLGEIAEKYLRKGSKVYIEGQLQTRKWADKAGVDRYTTEIVLQKFRGELMLMDWKSENQDSTLNNDFNANIATQNDQNNVNTTPQPSYAFVKGRNADPILDDEIPF